LQVVHSRTFANAAKGGGVGVRMLMPLVDMLNRRWCYIKGLALWRHEYMMLAEDQISQLHASP
jgi:hypothetical protein